MNNPDPARMATLLRAAFDMIRKAELSPTVESPLEILTHYDEADCDGSCLADDIATELGIERDAEPLAGAWMVKGDHPHAGRPDRRFTEQDAAESYAGELREAGFENVVIDYLSHE
jgi:hypothetical protein